MGTGRPKTPIVAQNPLGYAAPLPTERLWRRVHRIDAWREQGRRCKYCLSALPLKDATADHVTARRNGGTTSSKNIAAACPDCNNAKGHMPEKAFQKAIRRPTREQRWSLWRAWSRRRINARADAAVQRIAALVGLEVVA
jgi:5-methylcytosine-specific restriction endonuclease McrA